MKILVAEDDVMSQQLLLKLLQIWGHDVTLTADGAEAWEEYQREYYPIVISDWMMPKVDGVELIRRIRASEDHPYTYTVLLTAKSTTRELVEGMEAGADDFLGKPFDASELRCRVRAGERVIRLEQALAQRNTELAALNTRMSRDLEAAANIQRNMLPRAFPDNDVVAFAWNYEPCDELAGDTLNVLSLDERHIGLYVLDVSGHGVPSSLLSVTLHQLLAPSMQQSSLLKRPVDAPPGYELASPVEVAERLNHLFPLSDESGGLYFTLLYGVFDLDTRRLRYVQAGHPSPVHVAAGGAASVVEGGGLPIGFLDAAVFDEGVIDLAPGDRLYLYSDGIYEVSDAAGELFGQDRLTRVLSEARDESLADSLLTLVAGVREWGGASGLNDDISLLGLEIL